jgi:hypothetical protein
VRIVHRCVKHIQPSDGITGQVGVRRQQQAGKLRQKNQTLITCQLTWQQVTVPVETLERPTRLVQVVIVCDICAAPRKALNQVSKVSASCTHMPGEYSSNSDSRQRSPRQMTTDCCVSSEKAQTPCTVQEWIDLSCLLYTKLLQPSLYIWRYWLNTTATYIESTCGSIWMRCAMLAFSLSLS